MEQDSQLVAAAEACRRLQECHRLYKRAEGVADANPRRARELFGQIIEQAPRDSEVYMAARKHIADMNR
jgi:hypothetical protein